MSVQTILNLLKTDELEFGCILQRIGIDDGATENIKSHLSKYLDAFSEIQNFLNQCIFSSEVIVLHFFLMCIIINCWYFKTTSLCQSIFWCFSNYSFSINLVFSDLNLQTRVSQAAERLILRYDVLSVVDLQNHYKKDKLRFILNELKGTIGISFDDSRRILKNILKKLAEDSCSER